MIGKTLAHYEILEKIGAGGMGEVWRARDTSLDREVALKFLSPNIVQDIDHLSRFEREAKLLASLNHPNIAIVYGLHEQDGQRFLAMELVPGHDLHAYVAANPMPVADALPVAIQIAQALAAAHDQGVIHRDLKPSNVMITPEGKAKVLDFGLAKSVERSTQDSGILSASPTMTSPATLAGVILGTAAYMSPEQARGKPVDRRTDLWAFGCVLYEMLTGRTAFAGETVTDLIASIIHKDPDWDALPKDLPAGVRRVIERCLQKDPAQRLRDAGDAALLLEEARYEPAAGATPAAGPERNRTLGLVAVVAVAGALGLARLAPGLLGLGNPEPPTPARFVVEPPAGNFMSPGSMFLTPDGTELLWNGFADNQLQVWRRPLDSLEPTLVPLDRPGGLLAISPDGTQILIDSGGKLRKVPIEGGNLQPICDIATGAGRGASWGKDYIVFAEANGPIYRAPISGGEAEPVTTLDESAGEMAHRYPNFLPDGETFLYVSIPGKRRLLTVYAGHIDGREPVAVTTALNSPVYAEPGYLVFQRQRSIVAQAFDPKTLKVSGEPVPIAPANELFESAGLPVVSAARNGTLVCESPRDANTLLAWYDGETGEKIADLGLPPRHYQSPAVSPDGRYAALVIEESPEESDVWVLELERNVLTRLTQDPGPNADPRWSPDGTYIAYGSNQDGPWNIYRKPFAGSGPAEPVVVGPTPFKNPRDWSPDGRYLLYDRVGDGTGMDLWVATVDGSAEPRLYVGGETNQNAAAFSPDGRWVAYQSFETGQSEVYVASFPEPTRKYRVSVDGGGGPSWSPDGKKIQYGWQNELLRVPFQAEPEVKLGNPQKVFDIPREIRGGSGSPDGRIFCIVPATERAPRTAAVLLNWMEALK